MAFVKADSKGPYRYILNLLDLAYRAAIQIARYAFGNTIAPGWHSERSTQAVRLRHPAVASAKIIVDTRKFNRLANGSRMDR